MRTVVGPLLLSVISAACAPAPAALSQSDIDAIRAASKSYEQAALQGDMARMANTFEADGKFLAPNAPILNGVAEIQKWGEAFPPVKSLTLEPIEIEGQGNTAWTRGRYSLVIAPPGQAETSDTGKYIEIWRKQADGSWKLHRDIFNSDLPLPVSPTPAAAPVPAKKN